MTHCKRYIILLLVIGVSIFIMNQFEDNLYIKAFFGIMILGIFFMIRSVKHAKELPPDVNPDIEDKLQTNEVDKVVCKVNPGNTINHEDQIDRYLKLMIEVDEELRKEGTIDPNSPCYNMHLNYRISERLEANK